MIALIKTKIPVKVKNKKITYEDKSEPNKYGDYHD